MIVVRWACILIALVLYGVAEAGLDIYVEPVGGAELAPGGVFVGELVLRNSGSSELQLLAAPTQWGGAVMVTIAVPGGAVIYACPSVMVDIVFEPISLEPGAEVRVPICLVRYDDDHIFQKEGGYLVHVRYRGSVRIAGKMEFVERNAPGVPVVVDGESRGYDQFAREIRMRSVVVPFYCDDCFESVFEGYGEGGRYDRERAKLLLFQYGRSVVLKYLRGEACGQKEVDLAEKMLKIAEAGNLKAGIWRSIVDDVTSGRSACEAEARERIRRSGFYVPYGARIR